MGTDFFDINDIKKACLTGGIFKTMTLIKAVQCSDLPKKNKHTLDFALKLIFDFQTSLRQAKKLMHPLAFQKLLEGVAFRQEVDIIKV